MKPCLHCHKYKGSNARGLCNRCYARLEIRKKYPTQNPYSTLREPTEAEVEATVVEQSRPENLPAWWPAAGERDIDGD